VREGGRLSCSYVIQVKSKWRRKEKEKKKNKKNEKGQKEC
jgi:hypothetical protein